MTVAQASPLGLSRIVRIRRCVGVFLALVAGGLLPGHVAPASAATEAVCEPTAGYNNCSVISYTGQDQLYVVPATVTSIRVAVWGAGGGGTDPSYYVDQAGGGAGGYSVATIAVTPGQALTLRVGEGGQLGSSAPTYGGGGAGGVGITTLSSGASGGGLSGVFASGAPLVIAGGGGGSSPGSDDGAPTAGGGGGAVGGGGNVALSGSGGTQLSGGVGATQTGCAVGATAGTQYQGGNGSSPDASSGDGNEGGGGGGGGYFGGGGGNCQQIGAPGYNGPGGGGSGYIRGKGVTNAATTPGADAGAPGVSVSPSGVSSTGYVAGTGVGAAATNGGNGEIVVEATLPADLATTITQTRTTPVAQGTVFTTAVATINRGPAAATGLVTRVAFPVGLTPTSASGTGDDCQISGQVITCKAPTLPDAATNTITVTSDWTGQESGGTLTTSATATSSTLDPDTTNNTAAVSFEEPAATTSPPTVSARPAASPPETLAATGTAPINTPITVAAGLIFAGSVLLFVRRSRRSRSRPQD